MLQANKNGPKSEREGVHFHNGYKIQKSVRLYCMCLGKELIIFTCFVLVIEINYLLKLLSKMTHLLAHACSDSQ